MTNGSNQQRRFETKLNLNLFKNTYKKLYKLIFVELFYIFIEQLFNLFWLLFYKYLIISGLTKFFNEQKTSREY